MIHSFTSTLIAFFCITILLSFASILLLLKTPLVYFFKDKPGTRKIHQRAIPRAGGICVAIAFGAILLIWHSVPFQYFPSLPSNFFHICLIVTIGIVLVGFFDDTTSFVILNKAKFLIEFLIAVEIVVLFGIQFSSINFFGIFTISNKLLLSVISIFWMVGVANAFNIIDGIDGLAGTISLISFISTGILSFHANMPEIGILCIIIAGCILGFLYHNISPARVFLGDTGSLFFGMILSILLMYLVSQAKSPMSINTAFLIAGFPILDVAVAMTRRFLRALLDGRGLTRAFKSITIADSEHTHHRLIYRGLSHTQATLIIATLSATLCIAGIYINMFEEFKFVLVIYVLVVVFWFLYELNFIDRFIVYIRFLLRQKAPKPDYRIGVIDADSVLHHALIHFKQRKFSFDFISHQEVENNDSIRRLRLQEVKNSNKQFFISATWASDTRKFSREMINAVIGDWAINAATGKQYGTDGRKKKSAMDIDFSSFKPHTAIVINCRNANELEQKMVLGQQLGGEMRCAIIMITEHLPNIENAATKNLAKNMIFVRKPFYSPVFFKELFQLALQWNKLGSPGNALEESIIMKRMVV